MKKCPFCKAEIEDNARFCLYCMTPLNRKKVILPPKRMVWWPFAAAEVLLLTLLAVLLLTSGENRTSPQETTPPTTTTPATIYTTAPTTAPTQPTTETVNPNSFPRAKWEEPETGIVYEYRAAVQEDVMGVDYQVTANDVVIIGVEPPDNRATYTIPAYIDGKYRVIALAEASFWEFQHRVCDIDTVYLPDTVVALDKGAFWGSGMDDLYISGEVLAKGHGSYVIRDTVIHCSKTCQDQNGEKYSDSEYWKEWNG